MTVQKLIDVLMTVEDKSVQVVTLARKGDSDNTHRGISQIFKSRDVLKTPRIVIADGKGGL